MVFLFHELLEFLIHFFPNWRVSLSANILSNSTRSVAFFRPSITEAEIDEVVACLRSGWLTTGPRTKQFETEFAEAIGTQHAVAVNSCTAALHLAVEALGLKAGQGVLVPTMTFAATAEIVRYQGGIPILVDCEAVSLNIDLDDAKKKIEALRAGKLPCPADTPLVGIIPVHVGGAMCNMADIGRFASEHGLWVVEDSAHALPASFRNAESEAWIQSGQNTAAVTCFSFYANKTITTGEGGMAVTADPDLAARMRQMSLHGLSNDAWKRFSGGVVWDYRILAPGYKYNLTDIASSIGIHQMRRSEKLRQEREEIAARFLKAFNDVDEIEMPEVPQNRIHSWHLFPIRMVLSKLTIDRNEFITLLREKSVGCSVHWRPLHLHTYYENEMGWPSTSCPVASREWERLISLPLFPGMTSEDEAYVVETVREICRSHRRSI